MASTTDLEEEIRLIEKEKEEAERAFNALDARERRHLADMERKIARLASGKRGRDEEEKNESDYKREEEYNHNDEQSAKRTRASSVEKPVSSQSESRQPKLTSAIVAPMGEKQKESSHRGGNDKTRNRKMFGVVLGTLNRFKSDINQKTEALIRREKLEKEVDTKVRQDQEALQTKITDELKQEKEKVQQKREELKKKLEEKEQELMNMSWSTHRKHLSHFEKTTTKPCIYYKRAKPEKNDAKKEEEPAKEEPKKEEEDHDHKRGPRSRSRSASREGSRSPKKDDDSMQQ